MSVSSPGYGADATAEGDDATKIVKNRIRCIWGTAIFFRPTGKGGRGREDGEETGQSEGKGRERDGTETVNKGMEKRKRWGGPDVRQKAERARKGKMAEERKGNKKMWSQGRNCRRGTWPHWKGKYVIVLQEATYDRCLEHVLISRWRDSNGWPPGSGG